MTEPTVFSPFIKQCFVCATVCMNVLSNGCAYGFPAVLLPQLKLPGSPIPLTKAQESWIAAVFTIAMMVGNFTMPILMGKLGRKNSHFFIIIPITVGWLLIIFASNVEMLLAARIMQGISFGQVVPIRAVMIGEYTSPNNRGAFLTMNAVAQTSGIFVVHLLGYLVSWKMTAAICITFSVISFVMTFIIPESPSWLASKGRYEESKKYFEWLRGLNENDELIELIQARKDYRETENKSRFKEIICKVEFYKPITITLHISLLGYMSGGMIIAVYGQTIISEVMGAGVDPQLWLVSIDILRIISSFFAVYFMKKFNRRTVTFTSVGLCLAMHIAVVIYIWLVKFGAMWHVYWIPAVLLHLQSFSISAGIVPIITVIAGEVFPLAYRSLGISVSTAIATAFHFVILKTFPYLVTMVGIEGVYGINAVVICYCMIVCWFMMPETKGRTLQQIEDGFIGIEKTGAEAEPLNELIR
ncbi:facilitated trehalose transporter Tret1-like [Pieris rapae]|uniref:facilitated trehalose transporter Tret1-like n=1 Tax=Pieris rapae TaxID=64459 RepID=UPI001E27A8EE|nr:facilitated trehalose transporter Tret1-like [Pieris rapae]